LFFGEETFLSEEETIPSPSRNNRDVPKGELYKECNLPQSPLASGEVCEPNLLFEMVIKRKRITFFYIEFVGISVFKPCKGVTT